MTRLESLKDRYAVSGGTVVVSEKELRALIKLVEAQHEALTKVADATKKGDWIGCADFVYGIAYTNRALYDKFQGDDDD